MCQLFPSYRSPERLSGNPVQGQPLATEFCVFRWPRSLDRRSLINRKRARAHDAIFGANHSEKVGMPRLISVFHSTTGRRDVFPCFIRHEVTLGVSSDNGGIALRILMQRSTWNLYPPPPPPPWSDTRHLFDTWETNRGPEFDTFSPATEYLFARNAALIWPRKDALRASWTERMPSVYHPSDYEAVALSNTSGHGEVFFV
jgi:hypothetical protein